MSITIEPLSSRRHRKEFISLPFRLYAQDPNWVPPLIADMKERLDQDKHPFYSHGKARHFLALRNRLCVGRAAALIDKTSNDYHNEKVVGFGLIEFERDIEAAKALLREAARWGIQNGMDTIRGPFSYSTNEECGTLIQGFDSPPFVMMPYNAPWHAELFEELGLEKAFDLLAYQIDKNKTFDRMRRIAEKAAARNRIKVRPVDLKRFPEEIETIRSIYNASWEKNRGFVPMERREFDWHAQKMKQILVPSLALIAEIENVPAGFSLSLPDINQVLRRMGGRLFPFGIFKFLALRKKITSMRAVAMGIRPEHRSKGAEGVLMLKTIDASLSLGHEKAELSWVLEENGPIRKLAENMGAKQYKRYRIWEAPVERIAG